jgi:hypothetical protein
MDSMMKVSEYSAAGQGSGQQKRLNSADPGNMVPMEKYIAEIQKRDQKIGMLQKDLEEQARMFSKRIREEEKKAIDSMNFKN